MQSPTILLWNIGWLFFIAAMIAMPSDMSAQDKPPLIRLLPNDAAIVEAGKMIFADQCAACHGADLSGEPGWPDWKQRKPNGRLPAPPHDANGHTWHHDDGILFEVTKLGTAGYLGDATYESDMAGFADVLSDADIVAALSFIKSTWSGREKDYNDRVNRQAAQETE